MAMLRKTCVDVVLPVSWRGWTTDDLRKSLFALARQEMRGLRWRVMVVDGSCSDFVAAMSLAILGEGKLCYEPALLKTRALSDLYYQGVSASRSTYLAYIEPGRDWDSEQLLRLVGTAKKTKVDGKKVDMVAEGNIRARVDWLSDRPDALFPLLGCEILHTREIYDRTSGWPRRRNDGSTFRLEQWRNMVYAGAELHAIARPFVPSSKWTDETKRATLFSDA